MRVLFVEDSDRLQRSVATGLRHSGYAVDVAGNGPEGLWYAQSNDYDVIVLDLMLPGMGGLDVLRRVRAQSPVPVLILTARGEDVDRILGLEIGADDYLPKPFNPRELIARIRAILRRTSPPPERSASLTVNGIRLDPAAREVWIDGEPLDLTSVEFTLLETLLRDAGHVVTREALTETVLGRTLGPFDRVIDVHISNLRKKLSAAHTDDRIKAVRGSGYLFALRSETAK